MKMLKTSTLEVLQFLCRIILKRGAALISKRMGNFFYKPFTKNKKPQPRVGLICNVSISHEK